MANDTGPALTFAKPSPRASTVLELRHAPAQSPAAGEVAVQLLHAPVNPQDLLIIAGKYPIRPRFHTPDGGSIAGYDGVGRIEAVGSGVAGLKLGDLVIPTAQGLGTWRRRAVWSAGDVVAVPPCTDARAAALLRMAVLPAYLLLEDVQTLKPGDWVIQNAGTSAVAQLLAQLAKLRGVRTISVFRDRVPGRGADESNDQTKARLQAAGVDIALPESELDTTTDLDGKNIVLALDSVWGASGEKLVRRLAKGGVFVNYGLLGGIAALNTPLQLTHEALFGRLVTVRSFRSSESLAKRSHAELQALLAWLVSLFNDNVLKVPPLREIKWHGREGVEAEVRSALEQTEGGHVGLPKLVFDFSS